MCVRERGRVRYHAFVCDKERVRGGGLCIVCVVLCVFGFVSHVSMTKHHTPCPAEQGMWYHIVEREREKETETEIERERERQRD